MPFLFSQNSSIILPAQPWRLQANRVHVLPCRGYASLPIRTLSNTFVMWSSVRRSGNRGPRNVRQLQRFVVEEWDRIAQRTSEVRNFEPWRSYWVLSNKLQSLSGIVVVILIQFRTLIWNGSRLVAINDNFITNTVLS